jgi:hypothetical protein
MLPAVEVAMRSGGYELPAVEAATLGRLRLDPASRDAMRSGAMVRRITDGSFSNAT